MSTTPLTDGMQALINYANETTGETDTTLSDAIDSLVSGYGSGGSGGIDFLEKRFETEIEIPEIRYNDTYTAKSMPTGWLQEHFGENVCVYAVFETTVENDSEFNDDIVVKKIVSKCQVINGAETTLYAEISKLSFSDEYIAAGTNCCTRIKNNAIVQYFQSVADVAIILPGTYKLTFYACV